MQRNGHLPQLSWQWCTITIPSIWKFSSSFSKKREENKTLSKYILYICNLNNQQLTYNQQEDYEC